MMSIFVLFVALAAGTPEASPRPLLQADITDAAGDADHDPRVPVSPDLRSATVQVSADGHLTLAVHLAPGTFIPNTTFVQFGMDFDDSSDERPPAGDRCCEYIVDIEPAGHAATATMSMFSPAGRYQVIAQASIKWLPDGAVVSVPAALLPKDHRRIILRVVAGVRLDDRATTPILDRMPDAGLVAVPWGRRTTR
jgi:hypothetical protein